MRISLVDLWVLAILFVTWLCRKMSITVWFINDVLIYILRKKDTYQMIDVTSDALELHGILMWMYQTWSYFFKLVENRLLLAFPLPWTSIWRLYSSILHYVSSLFSFKREVLFVPMQWFLPSWANVDNEGFLLETYEYIKVNNISDNLSEEDRCCLSKDYIPALLEGKEEKDSYQIQFCFTELHEAAKGEHCPEVTC